MLRKKDHLSVVAVDGRQLPITILEPENGQDPLDKDILLYICGATAGSEKSMPLLHMLAEKAQVALVAFDPRGQIQKTTDFAESLRTRIEDARTMMQWIRSRCPGHRGRLIVWGHSMGAHIAAYLAEGKPDGILLTSGAAYNRMIVANRIPFGEEQKKVLNLPDSWRDSEAPWLLRDFEGDLLVMTMEFDEVVRPEVSQMYLDAAQKARHKEKVTIPFKHVTTFDDNEVGRRKRAWMTGCIKAWLEM